MTSSMPLRVGLVCDREDWITGTFAHAVRRHLGASGRFDFQIVSTCGAIARPCSTVQMLRRCDVVHWLSPYDYHNLASLLGRAPQICTIHHCLDGDDHVPDRYQNVRILTVSERSAEMLRSRGFPKIDIIHNGLDAEVFVPCSQLAARDRLGIASDIDCLLGFFGKGSSNPADRKGTSVLVEVVRILARDRRIGILLSGEGWSDLSAKLERNGAQVINQRAKSLAEMAWFYAAIDLYLCTSRVEGGPMPVLEAMACERPVISTPVGHVPELLIDGRNGLIVPVDDVHKTVEAVRSVMSDLTLRDSLARAGRAEVIERWTWEKILLPLADIYAQVAATTSCPSFSMQRTCKDLTMLLARSIRYRFRATVGAKVGGVS